MDREPLTRDRFWKLYHDLERGRITRRRFLEVTGIGAAAAVIAACQGGASPTPGATATATPGPTGTPAAEWTPPEGVDLGETLNLTSWFNYHDQATLDRFKELTGVTVNLVTFGSNEEMLANLQAGGTGWDVLVPTNYTFPTYVELALLEPLDMSKLPNFDLARQENRFLEPAYQPPGSTTLYGINKDWGTTGYVINTDVVTGEMTTWKDFWDRPRDTYSGKVTIHDYQLTSIGNALKYYGYSFNSVDPAELKKAEELLLDVKRHLFGITSDYQPPMKSGDAVMAMAWTGDAVQLNRTIPSIQYVIGREGGEIWSDFYAVVASAPHREAAYAFVDYMAVPAVAAKDALYHGYPLVDSAATELLPDDFKNNPIIYPAEELLTPLEFGAAVTLTDENRAELWARVKSA